MIPRGRRPMNRFTRARTPGRSRPRPRAYHPAHARDVRRGRVRAMGQDRWARRRRRRPRTGPGTGSRRARRARRGLPAALSLRPGPGGPAARGAPAGRARQGGSRRHAGSRRPQLRRLGLPAAPGGPACPLRSGRPVRRHAWRVPRQRATVCDPGARRPRGPAGRGATGGRHRDPRLARVPGRHPARPGVRGRPGRGRRRHHGHAPQPGLPRLDAARPGRAARPRQRPAGR